MLRIVKLFFKKIRLNATKNKSLSSLKRTCKAFTLAETMITLAIIAVIAALVIGVIKFNKIKQKDLLGRFNITFNNLSGITESAMQASKSKSNWIADVHALSNLSCKDEHGNDVENKSLCLKTALMSVSSIPKDCVSDEECFSGLDKLKEDLKSIIPTMKTDELVTFRMSGGVSILASYLDSACELEIPVNKYNDEIETVKGCGVFVVDVNGREKPNHLIIDENKVIDRFLIAITPNGLVKSNYLDKLVCSDDTQFNPATGACEKPFVCPYDMDLMHKLEQQNNDSLIKKDDIQNEACYLIKCKVGEYDPSTFKCPEPCPNEDEVRVSTYVRLVLPQSVCCVPIYTQKDLANVNNDLSRTYCLMEDIELDETKEGFVNGSWQPIGRASGSFEGEFYGSGHVIRKLKINTNNSEFAKFGLFSALSNKSSVLNLGLEDMDITVNANNDKETYVGGLCGNIYGSGSSSYGVYTTGKINVTAIPNSKEISIGGITGAIFGESLSAGYNTADINVSGGSYYSRIYLGGIAGQYQGNYPQFSFYNLGSITLDITEGAYFVGGIIGDSMSSFGSTLNNGIYNAGNIKVVSNSNAQWGVVGGLIGNSTAEVGYSYNIGNIEHVINGESYSIYTGGLVGMADGFSFNTISKVYNMGNVNSNYKTNSSLTFTGGILGGIPYNNSTGHALEDMYNWGNVSSSENGVAAEYNGGVVGYITYPATNAYSKDAGTGRKDVEPGNVQYISINSSFNPGGVWYKQTNLYPTIHPYYLPPQPHRDCRYDPNAIGGCYDVFNMDSAIGFMTSFWAWRSPDAGGIGTHPVLSWNCKPYRSDGFDCCRPAAAGGSDGIPVCPAMQGNYSNKVNYTSKW